MPPKRPRALARWFAGIGAALGVVVIVGACSSPEDIPLLGDGTHIGNADATTVCVDGHEGCPCTTAGQTAACGEVVQQYENYVSCSKGTSTCTGGTWGPCQGGNVVLSKSTRGVTIADRRDPETDLPRVAFVTTTCVAGSALTASSPCDVNPMCQLTVAGASDIGDASSLSITESGAITIPGISTLDGGADSGATCTGLQCNVHYCAGNANGTTITGTVFDPAGNNPLYNAWVYIPVNGSAALPVFPAGVQCSTCAGAASLSAVAVAQTAADGTFTLTNVPVGTNIPIVVQMGKWRREILLPTITQCINNPISNGTLRLPRNQTDGLNNHADMPQIAFVDGAADPFECMLLKTGIDPNEFGSSSLNSSRRIHYYDSPEPRTIVPYTTSPAGPGDSIDPAYGNVVTADKFWNNANSPWNLSAYDVVILTCEALPYNVADRSTTGYANLVTYAGNGGRIFLTHYQLVWLQDSSAASGWPAVVNSWTANQVPQDPLNATIVTSGFPKGAAFQTWLGNVGALTSGQLPLHQARENQTLPLSSNTQSWMNATNTVNPDGGAPVNVTFSPSFTFNTPLAASAANQCGRVVFSDYHVSTSAQTLATGTGGAGAVPCAFTADCGYGSTCPTSMTSKYGTCSAVPCTTQADCNNNADPAWNCQGVTNSCSRNTCVHDSDCANGVLCRSSVCGCKTNADCGSGGTCVAPNCTHLPSTCATNADCGGSSTAPSNATCTTNSGTCAANSCASNNDCASFAGSGSSTVVAGQERCSGNPLTCNGCLTDSDCPGASVCAGAVSQTCTGNANHFPYECAQGMLDPQEAALEFEFFDLSACVSPNGIIPQGPPAPVTVYKPVTFTVDYQSTCPSGTAVAWRELDYQATVPSTASIVFSAQTASALTDGGLPSYSGVQAVTLATATSAAPNGAALIDAVSTDGGAGGAFQSASPRLTSLGDLRLTITLNPTSNQSAPPTLITWQVKSDCPPSE